MKSIFQSPPRAAIALLTATGLTVLTATPNFSAPPGDAPSPAPSSSPSSSPPSSPSSPSSPTLPPPSSPPPSQTSKQPDDPMKRDRVSIDEVFPEYCRMYFPSRGTVSMFEYRERMHLCLYGPDRGFF